MEYWFSFVGLMLLSMSLTVWALRSSDDISGSKRLLMGQALGFLAIFLPWEGTFAVLYRILSVELLASIGNELLATSIALVMIVGFVFMVYALINLGSVAIAQKMKMRDLPRVSSVK